MNNKSLVRNLSKNTLINLLGQAIPFGIAFISVPLIIKYLGVEKFGILSIAWLLIGYFSLFDFGIGRAVTKFVAESMAQNEVVESSIISWSATLLLLMLGGIVGIGIIAFASLLVDNILRVDFHLRDETIGVIIWIGISMPFVLASVGLRGVLEACQEFFLANVIRIPMMIANYVIPIVLLPFGCTLVTIVGMLAISRIILGFVYVYYVHKRVQLVRFQRGVFRKYAWKLITYGKWMTVSNFVGPVMVYLDRFFIGFLLSVTAIGYYVAPYDFVTKMLVFASSFTGVLFPAFSSIRVSDHTNLPKLYFTSLAVLSLLLLPITVFLISISKVFLLMWLGSAFAANSSFTLQVLTVGVFLNSLGSVPFTALQALSRPDLTGKVHLIELPFYCLLLWVCVTLFGITGAAIAWTTRVFVDTTVLLVMTQSHIFNEHPSDRRYYPIAFFSLTFIAVSFVVGNSFNQNTRIAAALLLSLSSALLMWVFFFRKELDSILINMGIVRQVHGR